MWNSAWPLSKDLERKLRLEKVPSSKHLGLAVETEEERRARLENNAATIWFSLTMETEEEKKARLEKGGWVGDKKGLGMVVCPDERLHQLTTFHAVPHYTAPHGR